MPGVVQHTRDSLLKAVAEAADLGLGGVMLFGIPESKDATGSGAIDPRASSTSRSPTWSPRWATRSP
jgi:delta-aminolevulinic acid dehydratase/porphobilinogen synthase